MFDCDRSVVMDNWGQETVITIEYATLPPEADLSEHEESVASVDANLEHKVENEKE